jgi:endonuclease/exonuclease/phosphatase family metal-dependent hydrolase
LAGDDLTGPHRHPQGQLSRRRRAQVDELIELVEATTGDGPTIVAGDFNIEASTATGRWLQRRFAALGFVDAWATVGEGDGRTDALGRIDYVFVRGAEVLSCAPVRPERPAGAPERDALATISDHFALEAVVRIS